ncbi:hypothetical protein KIW84_055269 [Lathyrus oleraceus]|uniref:H(+)-exporting diphosphatase n=1 Tax=Pisum sativum TaxID=3888 RepID=A0A9D5AIF0_PEA|nr:hypothetical protein KIW84_055269 [Pisum sativum]
MEFHATTGSDVNTLIKGTRSDSGAILIAPPQSPIAYEIPTPAVVIQTEMSDSKVHNEIQNHIVDSNNQQQSTSMELHDIVGSMTNNQTEVVNSDSTAIEIHTEPLASLLPDAGGSSFEPVESQHPAEESDIELLPAVRMLKKRLKGMIEIKLPPQGKLWYSSMLISLRLIIGFVTEYCTGDTYSPVQDVADSCRTGAATNVIFGLAIGMQVSTGVAIDAYSLISDNAGVVAEMAGMCHKIRERTDALDAAGNTTAAIGKGFAIGYAALVSLALFGAFVSHAGITTVDVLTPKVFIGLIVGAMLSYWFSDLTMKSVGSAALKMVEKVCRQFNMIPGLMEGTAKPDYATCATITTSDPSHGSCLYLGSFGNKNSTFGNFTAPLMNSNSDSSAYNIHSRKLRIKSLLMVTGFLILGVVLL